VKLGVKYSMMTVLTVIVLSLFLEGISLFLFSQKIHAVSLELAQEKLDRLANFAYQQDELFFEGLYSDEFVGRLRLIDKLRIDYRQIKDNVSYVFIVDDQGKAVLHPAESRWGGKSQWKVEKGQRIFNESLMKKIREKKTGEFEYSWHGVRKWCVFRVYEPWGWVFCETTSIAKRDKALVFFLWISVGVSFLITILSVLVFLWVSQRFTRPLNVVVNRLQKIAKGEISPGAIRKDKSPGDEIEMLDWAVNQMAEDLKKTTVSRDSLVREIAVRKIAEEELKDSEDRLKVMFDYAPDAYYLFDLTGTFLDGNKAAEKISGYKKEELIGKNFLKIKFIAPSDMPKAAAALARSAMGLVSVTEEYTIQQKDGSVVVAEVRLHPVKIKGKVQVLGCARDITERKRQETIAEQELNIRKVIGKLLELSLENSALEDYLGRALDLVLGISWFSLEAKGSIFLVGEDPATLVMKVQKGLPDFIQKSCALLPFGKCHCGRAALTGRIEFSNRITERHEIHYDGMASHGHYCVPILFGEKVIGVLNTYVRENSKNDEKIEHFLWMIANALAGAIEQKRSGEALRKAHDELEVRVRERTEELAENQVYIQKILATITDYIYTVTVKDGVAIATTHQPTCFEVTGYTAEEFKNKPDLLEKIVHEEDRSKVRAFFAAVLAGNTVKPAEYRIWHKDGGIRWVRNTPVLHHDSLERLTSYDGIISDMTEKMRSETLLIESMERVARANRVKDQFLANMSHEVRTPLNAIIGFSSLLENTSLDPVQHEYVKMLRGGGEALFSLITDVIDFSKIAAGEVRLENVHFDLERLIQSVVSAHTERIKKKGLRVFYVIGEQVPHGFRGDSSRLRRILTHLLSNAVKFTEQGEIEIRVTLDKEIKERDSRSEAMVRIAVRDTGAGIPSEKREAVFEAFEQVDISTTRKYGGAGLGLSIAKTLVKLMGGTIGVQSELGKGSTFSLVLPLEVESGIEEVQIFPLKDAELEGKKILILDDDEVAREIFTRYCEEAKMAVVCSASSAQDALKWLSEQSSLPDIFLVDILMPDLNGYEVAEKIRGNKKYEAIKLVAVTVDAREGVAFRARQSGFDAFLPKPVSRENLITIIKTVLGDKREKILSAEIVTQYTAEELASKGLKILVVEDNPASQELLSIILRGFEFGVEIASDGREAVEKVEKDPYDLILMDLQMPGMGGVEATKIIREQLHKTMPILALTAGVSDDDKGKCLAAGMNDYLSKPIEVPKLKDKIFHWIKQTPLEKPVNLKKEQSVMKWDKQKAIKELGVPEELYRELVFGFVEQSVVVIQNLEGAVRDNNYEEVAKGAHFIKGAAGNLRIEEIHVAAKELEAVAKGDRNPGMMEKRMGDLRNAMEEMKKNL